MVKNPEKLAKRKFFAIVFLQKRQFLGAKRQRIFFAMFFCGFLNNALSLAVALFLSLFVCIYLSFSMSISCCLSIEIKKEYENTYNRGLCRTYRYLSLFNAIYLSLFISLNLPLNVQALRSNVHTYTDETCIITDRDPVQALAIFLNNYNFQYLSLSLFILFYIIDEDTLRDEVNRIAELNNVRCTFKGKLLRIL